MRNKFYIIFFVLILIGLIIINSCVRFPKACPLDAKRCQDGSWVSRNPEDCEFNPCLELKYCGTDIDCPDGFKCYKFQDNNKSYCFADNTAKQKNYPCIECPSYNCEIQGINPRNVICK